MEEILASRFPALPAAAKELILKTYRMFNSSSSSAKKSGGGDGGFGPDGANSKAIEDSMEDGIDEEKKRDREDAFVPPKEFMTSSRQFTLRDLMKVAGRCERYSDEVNKGSSKFLTEAQKRALLSEVVDVFAASARHADQYEVLVRRLGDEWGVPAGEIAGAVLDASPPCDVTDVAVTAGRGRVLCTKKKTSMQSASGKQQFALTKHARRLLDRLALDGWGG